MNRQFPALRGIAILLVVVNHAIVLSLQNTTEFNLPKPGLLETNLLLFIKEIGVIAVPTFLFLAGSFMVYSIRDRPLLKAYQMLLPSLQNAILPYLIWSVVFYFTVFLVRHETYNIFGYLKNLIVGYPYNFVPILVFYILISPLIIKIAEKHPLWVFLFFALVQITLANISVPGIIGFKFPEFMKYFAIPVLRIPLALWAVFYPMGIIYTLHSKGIQMKLKQFWWIFAGASLVLYILAALQETGLIVFKAAEWLLPVFIVPIFPVIQRNKIFWVRFFEKIGKRSYGIYLLNIIFITTLVFLTYRFIPGIYHTISVQVVLIGIFTLYISTLIMDWVEKGPGRTIYRIIFG